MDIQEGALWLGKYLFQLATDTEVNNNVLVYTKTVR